MTLHPFSLRCGFCWAPVDDKSEQAGYVGCPYLEAMSGVSRAGALSSMMPWTGSRMLSGTADRMACGRCMRSGRCAICLKRLTSWSASMRSIVPRNMNPALLHRCTGQHLSLLVLQHA